MDYVATKRAEVVFTKEGPSESACSSAILTFAQEKEVPQGQGSTGSGRGAVVWPGGGGPGDGAGGPSLVNSDDGLLGLGVGDGLSTAMQVQDFLDPSDVSVVEGAAGEKADEYEPGEKPGVGFFQGAKDQLDAEGPFSPMCEMPLPTWVERLVSQVCSAQTKFSSFVKAYLSSCRRGRLHTSSTALFPIPAPDLSVWWSDPAGLSQSKRMHVAQVKLLHLVVAALNFQYFRNPFEIVENCRRRPGPHHVKIFSRLLAHIKVCGGSGMVSISGCGRKSFQLDARLKELFQCAASLGLDVRGPYSDGGLQKVPVPKDDSVAEELRPYRSLDADRLKLSGCGLWRCEDFLPDLLYMPFMEPRCNVYEVPITSEEVPDNSKNDYNQMMKLIRVWDVNGLVDFTPCSFAPSDIRLCTRVFNNYKDCLKDRQIGDRRGQNKKEGRIQCGSENLPTAQTLLQLAPHRWSELLCGSITDRKDFYHQFCVSWEKMSLNAIYPWPRLSEVRGCSAAGRFINNFMTKKKKASREKEGDHLEGGARSILVEGDPVVVPCFRALFQGDHLGVEVATASHSRLLQQHQLLQSSSRLQSGSFIRSDETNDGLVIDDYFVLSREVFSKGSIDGKVEGSKSEDCLRVAKAAYLKENIMGSDEKDVVGSLRYKVIGAEVVSTLDSVSRGLVSLAAPADKRLGLAMISAILANQRFTSDSLHACLVGL